MCPVSRPLSLPSQCSLRLPEGALRPSGAPTALSLPPDSCPGSAVGRRLSCCPAVGTRPGNRPRPCPQRAGREQGLRTGCLQVCPRLQLARTEAGPARTASCCPMRSHGCFLRAWTGARTRTSAHHQKSGPRSALSHLPLRLLLLLSWVYSKDTGVRPDSVCPSPAAPGAAELGLGDPAACLAVLLPLEHLLSC